jgi:hypothetical protein
MPTTETQDGDMLKVAFSAAPQDVRDLIELGGFDEAMTLLRSETGLADEQADRVEVEVLMALLGITDPISLAENLEEKTGIAGELLEQVVAIAVAYVFAPLADLEVSTTEGEAELALPAPIAPATLPPAPQPAPVRTNMPPASPQPQQASYQTPPPRTAVAVETNESPLATFHANIPKTQPPARVAEIAPVTKAIPQKETARQGIQEAPHARTMASDIEAMQPPPEKVSAPMPVRPPAPPPPVINPVPVSPIPAGIRETVHADLKQYGIDPYREPLD